MKAFLLLLATFFGAGRLPRGPGTWGTAAAIPLTVSLMRAGPLWQMGFILLLFPLATYAAEMYERHSGRADAQEIVIDEVWGYMITMLWLPLTWRALLAGFLLFRLFDIWKPWPISYLNDNVKGGMGVMVDDIAAGIVANVILQQVLERTDWLGVQSIIINGS